MLVERREGPESRSFSLCSRKLVPSQSPQSLLSLSYHHHRHSFEVEVVRLGLRIVFEERLLGNAVESGSSLSSSLLAYFWALHK